MDLTLFLPFITLCIISFVAVYISLPPLISKLSQIGSLKRDFHKNEIVVTPSPGGLSVLFGFSAGATLTGLLRFDDRALLMIYMVTLLGAMVGTVDDLLNLRKGTIILLTFLISFPFVTFYRGSRIVIFPFLGETNLGLWFWPLSILGIVFLSNAVNIYAPLNGLEAGLGFITCSCLTICAVIYGSLESALMLSLMAASLLAFLRWNLYPSRVFIGNVGTYMIGTLIASSVIVGSIKTVALISCIPYILNFLLRTADKFRKYVATVSEDGLIVAEAPKTLWSLFILHNPRPEKTVVYYSCFVQVLFSIAAIIYSIVTTVY